MSFDIDIRPIYAIGIILDDSLNITDNTKISNLITQITDFTFIKDQQLGEVILKNITPEVKIKVYVGINRDIPQQIRSLLLDDIDEGGLINISYKFMWFGEVYTKTEMENRLRQWINQDGPTKVWIVDINTKLTGNLLTKFK
jgi:hypothetical protein